jgi:hypothetical protein
MRVDAAAGLVPRAAGGRVPDGGARLGDRGVGARAPVLRAVRRAHGGVRRGAGPAVHRLRVAALPAAEPGGARLRHPRRPHSAGAVAALCAGDVQHAGGVRGPRRVAGGDGGARGARRGGDRDRERTLLRQPAVAIPQLADGRLHRRARRRRADARPGRDRGGGLVHRGRDPHGPAADQPGPRPSTTSSARTAATRPPSARRLEPANRLSFRGPAAPPSAVHPRRLQGRGIYRRSPRSQTRQPRAALAVATVLEGASVGRATGYEETDNRFLSRAPGLSQGTVPRRAPSN